VRFGLRKDVGPGLRIATGYVVAYDDKNRNGELDQVAAEAGDFVYPRPRRYAAERVAMQYRAMRRVK
jgi:hypothetical protein